jgi:aryl-alcohol dehydrogenase-like predicted oxidoreductase
MSANSVPAVKLGDELSVSAIGFGAMALTPVYGEVDDTESLATPAQVALAWLRYRADALGVASVPIPGTRRATRVEENLGSLSVTLTPEQLEALDAAGSSVTGHRFTDLSWVSAGRE